MLVVIPLNDYNSVKRETIVMSYRNIAYLVRGTERQRAAYQVLQDLQVFDVLNDYDPVLVGTIPLDIDVEDSDLDIVCEARDLTRFEGEVAAAFGDESDFRVRRKLIGGWPSVVAKFCHGGFPIEVFGQARPVAEQNAYRHMVVEGRLLEIGGEKARRAIRQLKRAGLKTEPAFAQYFNLEGDPFQVLLDLFELSRSELTEVIG